MKEIDKVRKQYPQYDIKEEEIEITIKAKAIIFGDEVTYIGWLSNIGNMTGCQGKSKEELIRRISIMLEASLNGSVMDGAKLN